MWAKYFSAASSSGGRKGMMSTYSSRDLLEYRSHYPDNIDDPRRNKNLLFFQNKYPLQPEGVMIEEVLSSWKGRYRHLESSHSFIQWLFPIQEKGMNFESQVLQKHEIASMRADPAVLRRVVGVFKIMLDFYGMELVDEEKGIIRRLSEPDEYRPQYRNLNSSSHNYLRITRILKNLGEMGFEHLKIGWLECLFHEICVVGLLPNCESSFWNYWSGTIYDDQVRSAFLDKCERLQKEAKAARSGAKGIGSSSSALSPSPSQDLKASSVASVEPTTKHEVDADSSNTNSTSTFNSTPSNRSNSLPSDGDDNSNCEPRK